MVVLMGIVAIALFVVVIGYSAYRLEAFGKTEKVIICVIGIIISAIIASILFSISSSGIQYVNPELKKEIGKTLILVFTPINGLLFMPFVAKKLSMLRFDEITKEEALKKVIIYGIILIVLFIIETKYLESIQIGILNVANNM